MNPLNPIAIQNAGHPFAVAIDIQGNFHRGLMLGVLAGFVLGIATVAGAALLLLAMLR